MSHRINDSASNGVKRICEGDVQNYWKWTTELVMWSKRMRAFGTTEEEKEAVQVIQKGREFEKVTIINN